MQIGTRWKTGAVAPASLSPDVVAAITRSEHEMRDRGYSLALADMYWTLTWLEGRPVCSHQTGAIVSTNPLGEIHIRYGDEDVDSNDDSDDWLT